MKKIFFTIILIFLSLNINAEISQSGITNLKQLDKNGIIDLVNGNQLTGFISDGPFEGPITQTFYKDGKYETIFENKIYKGIWKVEGKKFLTKNNNASNFGVMYWYTGIKDGGTYAYIIAQGKIFHQYHEVRSVEEARKIREAEAEEKRIADAKEAEQEKKKAEKKDTSENKDVKSYRELKKLFYSLSNPKIPRASVENLVQLNNSQIIQTLRDSMVFGVQFSNDEDDTILMDPFSEVFDTVGVSSGIRITEMVAKEFHGTNEVFYYPNILDNLKRDPYDVMRDLGFSYNLPNPTPSELRKIIIQGSSEGGEEYTWGAHNDQICYKFYSIYTTYADRYDWDSCYFFYIGGKENNRKGYFSETKTSDFFARIDTLSPLGYDEKSTGSYYRGKGPYYKNLDNHINSLIAEQKIIDAKNIQIKKIKNELKAEEKRIAEIKKEEKSIENYIKKLKEHIKKLQDLELDSLKVEVDNLISEVENNSNSDLSVLKSLRNRLSVLNSSVELKIKAGESKQRILSLKNYPGFKDLKPGLHYDDLTEFCHLKKGVWVSCYEIDNIKFKGDYQSKVLKQLLLDMGPIVNSGGFLSVFGENDSNIFVKMKNTFDKKYTLDYGYSERDRQLFNKSEKSRLYRVYSKGQVVLEISRKEKDWSSDLWLYIHYLDPAKAKRFLEENRPIRASEDDF